MKQAGIAVLVVLGILALAWVVQGNDFFMYKFFAPKREAVRREVFVNTPSYVNGKAQFLARLRHEWESADADHREAICALARSEAATVDVKLLPKTLQSWGCVQ